MSETAVQVLQCPSCPDGPALVAVERSGITIDACRSCRGVWLDRGELDKLIELESQASGDFLDEIRGGGSGGKSSSGDHHGSSGHGKGHGSKGHGSSSGKKRRGGMFGELFDF